MKSDEWRTPQWLFDELNQEFNFDIDLCATKENSKCEVFCEDYLANLVNSPVKCQETGKLTRRIKCYLGIKSYKTAFMNPPYSNPKPFIEKAWEDSKHCKIVLLLKVDPSTKWWSVFWNYEDKHYRGKKYLDYPPSIYDEKIGPKPGCEVRFLPKRVQFDPPIEMVESSEVWLRGKSWVQKCKGKGYKKLPGPSFPVCIVIFDRRNI